MKKDLKLIESKTDSGIYNLKTSEALELVAMLIVSSRVVQKPGFFIKNPAQWV